MRTLFHFLVVTLFLFACKKKKATPVAQVMPSNIDSPKTADTNTNRYEGDVYLYNSKPFKDPVESTEAGYMYVTITKDSVDFRSNFLDGAYAINDSNIYHGYEKMFRLYDDSIYAFHQSYSSTGGRSLTFRGKRVSK